MKKILCTLLTGMMLVGCSPSNEIVNKQPQEKKDYKAILDSAKEIKFEESIISMGKKYSLYVGKDKVAEVTGKFLNAFGDVFTLKDADGNFLLQEKQIKRWGVKLNRAAEIMDKDEKTVGYLGEQTLTKLLSIGHTFHFYDKDQNEIGYSDEVNFSFFKEYKFYDNNKNVDYEVKEKFNLNDTYILTVKDTDSVPLYNAILMVCVQDAIKDADKAKAKAEKEKSKKDSKKKN